VDAHIDPAELSIAGALFSSVADEMGVTLGRTAHSPNIKERRDYSCAVFDPQGRLVAQAAHIPVHLGAMPESVAAAMPLAPFEPGDIVILNDPYLGGTHLPDITMVSPVFADAGAPASRVRSDRRASGILIGFVASRAHHADVGGISPGSMPIADELIQEGIVIPPIKLYEAGKLNRAVFDVLLRNMRNPKERRGDLDAQTAAHRTGEYRLREIAGRYGLEQTWRLMDELMEYAERMTRAAIATVPDGEYEFEDLLDDDGASSSATSQDGCGIQIRVRITVTGESLHADFTGSAPEQPSSVNAVAAVTRSAVYYCVRCLLDEAVPSNDGCFRPVTLTLPERSIVNAGPPRAVAAGNVETSQRIVDVVLGALAKALHDIVPAASQGTMNNITIGGPGELEAGGWDEFAYYETIGGGAGASPIRDGVDAAHTHMTNTLNTPVEAIEMTYPFRVVEYAIRRGSGGTGRMRGGDGISRTYEFLANAMVTLLTERRQLAPWGLAGGKPGTPGRNSYQPAGGRFRRLPGKATLRVAAGDRLTIETPGGGGWGPPGRA